MKIIPVVFTLIISTRLFALTDTLPSGVYSAGNIRAQKSKGFQSRQIVTGSTLDLSDLEVKRCTLRAGQTAPLPLSYNTREELVIVKEGDLTVTVDDSIKVLGAGGIVLIQVGDRHKFENSSNSPVTYYMVSFISKHPAVIRPLQEKEGQLLKNWNELTVKKTEKSESRPVFDHSSSMFERLEIHATILNPGFPSHQPHTHRAEEMLLMIRGNGEIQIGTTFRKTKPGDIILLNSNSLHAFKNTGTEPCRYFAIQWRNPASENISGDLYEMLTPMPGPQPRINGPLVYGSRPGHAFLYRIPCQGTRPVRFSVEGLPVTLKLDVAAGIISGITPPEGVYDLTIKAVNNAGKDKRKFKIVAGDKLALTPPMGWNDWYAYYHGVTDIKIREAADAMVSNGMADAGYQYVNIDDCWMNTTKDNTRNTDSLRIGPERDSQGNILANYHFPDMKRLTDYIHSKGLKAGIYSSPGPQTCGRYTGSYQHEEQDARQFAAWGFDFLKYDWCSYGKLPGIDKSLEAFQKPYRQMGNILKSLNRDVVFNICQYGYQDVWKWGASVEAQCWRTGGDLGGHLDRIFRVALQNAGNGEYSKPGEWNDPDYIQIGWIGHAVKSGEPGYIKMRPATQYAYMSLWCLMASPLIYSGDMTRLDKFSLNILNNPEVIDVDQDPLGKSGRVITHTDNCFLMVKGLADGSKAVGLFNPGKEPANITADWKELEIQGRQVVRDLWRQKAIGKYNGKFSAIVPAYGVVLVKIGRGTL